jgi:hypothetical protein
LLSPLSQSSQTNKKIDPASEWIKTVCIAHAQPLNLIMTTARRVAFRIPPLFHELEARQLTGLREDSSDGHS